MPLGCPIQDGDNNDCREDAVGVKRGLKSLCEAKPLSKWTFRLFVRRFYWIRVELRALDRIPEFFNSITWHRWGREVEDEVRREEGPGKLLGYRRTCVCSNIRCRSRCTRWKRLLNLRRRKTKGKHTSRGLNWVHALDGHDKSISYQNSTLPIAVYGCIDTCSRKMLRAKVWVYLLKARTIASKLWLDKGSENRSDGFNALLSPTASWGHGSSEDSYVWAINLQSGMCTFLCDAVFFLHQSTWILTLNICRNVLSWVFVIKNWNSIRTWWNS